MKFGALVAVAVVLVVTQANAHSWQSGAQPLTADEVGTVVSALERLADSAKDSGWLPGNTSTGGMSAGIYEFAVANGQLAALPEGTDRVIETFEALERGVVTPEGAYTDSPDFIFWFETLHLGDVPAVAAQQKALRAIRAVFARKGSP